VPRGIYLVFTNCTDPEREEEFNRWYTHTHLPDLSAARGFVTARRFENPNSKPDEAKYLAAYEFDSDDLGESIKDLLRLAMRAFAEGRHIDCIRGAPAGAGAPLLQEIDPSTLEPLERLDYPREVPEEIRKAMEQLIPESL
jgi:hypothetical protein